MSENYDKLFFNAIEISDDGTTVSASPNFLCPVCSERPVSKLTSGSLSIPQNRDLDINRLVTFTMPCCGTKINLYVAVHKTKGVSDLALCVSTVPIDALWYNYRQ